MNPNNFASQLPYPSTDGLVQNQHDLKLIIDDYSGIISEFLAVTQYVYHHQRANSWLEKEIGAQLLQIAIIEMRHLNILGECILKLGGNPKYITPVNGCNRFWNANQVYYGTNLKSMIQSDKLVEEITISNYYKHAKQASQPLLSEILLRIIEDEKIHLRLFDEMLAKLSNS